MIKHYFYPNESENLVRIQEDIYKDFGDYKIKQFSKGQLIPKELYDDLRDSHEFAEPVRIEEKEGPTEILDLKDLSPDNFILQSENTEKIEDTEDSNQSNDDSNKEGLEDGKSDADLNSKSEDEKVWSKEVETKNRTAKKKITKKPAKKSAVTKGK